MAQLSKQLNFGRVKLYYRDWPWLNAIWFQGAWAMAIIFGGSALIPLTLMLLLHFSLCLTPSKELKFIVVAAAPGILFDLTLASLKIYDFHQQFTVLGIPPWLALLWLAFAASLHFSLRLLFTLPKVAVVLAAALAPVSYYTAMRLGAVHFPLPLALTLPLISVGWTVLMLWFLRLEQSGRAAA